MLKNDQLLVAYIFGIIQITNNNCYYYLHYPKNVCYNTFEMSLGFSEIFTHMFVKI